MAQCLWNIAGDGSGTGRTADGSGLLTRQAADWRRKRRRNGRSWFARHARQTYTFAPGETLRACMNEHPNDDLEKFGAVAGMEKISVLQAFDRIVAMVEPRDPLRSELLALREGIADQEEIIGDARQMIEKLEEVIKKVTSPANRIGTYLGSPARNTAHIVVGGSDYYCNVDPRLTLEDLKKGTRVLVNEAYVVVGDLGFETAGPVTKITEVLGGDRLRVGGEHGLQSTILQRSAQLAKTTLKSGDEVRVDPGYRMALEALARPDSREHYLDDVPELPWEKVGGQDEALQDRRLQSVLAANAQPIAAEHLGDLCHRPASFESEIADDHIRLIHQHARAFLQLRDADPWIDVAVVIRTADDDVRSVTRRTAKERSEAIGGRSDLLHHLFQLLDHLPGIRDHLLLIGNRLAHGEKFAPQRIVRRHTRNRAIERLQEAEPAGSGHAAVALQLVVRLLVHRSPQRIPCTACKYSFRQDTAQTSAPYGRGKRG